VRDALRRSAPDLWTPDGCKKPRRTGRYACVFCNHGSLKSLAHLIHRHPSPWDLLECVGSEAHGAWWSPRTSNPLGRPGEGRSEGSIPLRFRHLN